MRPLSDLQVKVLLLAYKSHRVRPEYEIDTSIRQVLAQVYHFHVNGELSRLKAPGLVFNRKAVGVKRYQSAYAVVSRVFERLVTRQLATKRHGQGFYGGYGQGIKLTGAGAGVAEGIWQKFKKRR